MNNVIVEPNETTSIKEYMIQYSNDVIEGEIVACKKHIQACQRFLRDIERENTPDFPYYFDEEKAMHFIDWCGEFKHTKGKLAGELIELAPIQIFVFGNIYGWYEDRGNKRHRRRFSRAYWQMGRKNGKSQSLALVGSYEWAAFGEPMSEIYIGATKREQANIVWKEIFEQLKGCDFLQGKYKVAYGQIIHPKSGSIIASLSKDSGKTADGLSPQLSIIDEYHAHPNSSILDVMTSGQGARHQPLSMIITTAGFDLNGPCYRVEYDLVTKILDPNNPTCPENYFAMVNELDKNDDINDSSVWEKANPILCSYQEGIDYLQNEYVVSKDAPEKLRNFLTKNMDIWVSMADGKYIDTEKWARCHILNPKMPDLMGLKGYLGVDLSQKHDLTSMAIEFPLDDDYFAVLHHSFMPKERLFDKMKTDNVDYQLYADQGYLTLTEGEVIDYRYIKNHAKKLISENRYIVKELCFDPWSAMQFAQDMESENFEPIEIRQGYKTLSEPIKNFRERVLEGKIIHGDDPILKIAVGNAITKADPNGNIVLDKSKSTNRIDPLAAVINAHVRAMNHAYLAPDLNSHFLKGWRL
jgi:phage terminase large subunit-like protein